MNQLVLRELDLRQTDDVLEVGFGGGALLAAIHRQTAGQVIGVDPSAAMVERARRRWRGDARVRLILGSVQALPLADASVDKACSLNNIYFWPDPVAAMTELARVVRPGGALSICFEPPEELRKWPGHVHGFRMVDEAEVRKLMEESGFGLVRRAEGSGRKPDHFLCLTGERLGVDAVA